VSALPARGVVGLEDAGRAAPGCERVHCASLRPARTLGRMAGERNRVLEWLLAGALVAGAEWLVVDAWGAILRAIALP